MTQINNHPFAGAVRCLEGEFRTLSGANLSTKPIQNLHFLNIVDEDSREIHAIVETLKHLYPSLDWENWGIEIVKGNNALTQVVPEEKTILINRQAMGEFALLCWDLHGAFLQFILKSEYSNWLQDDQIKIIALYAQFRWFQQEGKSWQYDIFASLALPEMDQTNLASSLWGILPPNRASRFDILLRTNPLERQQYLSEEKSSDQCWIAACHYHSLLPKKEHKSNQHESTLSTSIDLHYSHSIQKIERAFSFFSNTSFRDICSPMPGVLSRYFLELKPHSDSTQRRLCLFRICLENQKDHEHFSPSPSLWPQLSLMVMNQHRHAKIHQALLAFQRHTFQRKQSYFWKSASDESLLLNIIVQFKLGEQDERFFRQATHIQIIWRDILHRNSSQKWAAELLFDALEECIVEIQKNSDLFFSAVIWSRSTETPETLPPPIQNLKELLWILSQAPASVLRMGYHKQTDGSDNPQNRWPMVQAHLKRFLHLAPPHLGPQIERIEEEHQDIRASETFLDRATIETDQSIPLQDLRGRIFPLLSRSEMVHHCMFDLEETTVLRVIDLDRILPTCSGTIRDNRFFSSFLFFFKTDQHPFQHPWNDLTLWIDKDLDITKTSNRQDYSTSIRHLMLQDGIWERTYRYQFLTMDQLLKKLKPSHKGWRNLLFLLAEEYKPIFERHIRYVLDYHFYMAKNQYCKREPFPKNGSETIQHPLMPFSMDEFEDAKDPLTDHIIESWTQTFVSRQSEDDRSWYHAHLSISQAFKTLNALIHDPQHLFSSKKRKDPYIECFIKGFSFIQETNEQEKSISKKKWIEQKIDLIAFLEEIDENFAIDFIQCLLNQVHPEHTVSKKLIQSVFKEDTLLFETSLSDTYEEEQQPNIVLKAYLQRPNAQLIDPTFLHVFAHCPSHLLQQILCTSPSSMNRVEKVVELLQIISPEDTHQLQFAEFIQAQKQKMETQSSGRQQIPSDKMLLPAKT